MDGLLSPFFPFILIMRIDHATDPVCLNHNNQHSDTPSSQSFATSTIETMI